MCADVAGLPREEAKDAIFWDVFEVRNPVTGERAEPWVPCEAAAAKGQKFVLHKVRRCGDPAEEPSQFTMRFRCATFSHFLIEGPKKKGNMRLRKTSQYMLYRREPHDCQPEMQNPVRPILEVMWHPESLTSSMLVCPS